MHTPEKTINYNVFLEGDKLFGIASAQLPAFEAIKESFKAAGMMGETEIPIIGQMGIMNLTLSFHKLLHNIKSFIPCKKYVLDLRVASQALDSGKADHIVVPERWSLTVSITKVDPGKLEGAAGGDGSIEGVVDRAQHWIDGAEVLEFDRFNNIFTIDGEDTYQAVRSAIGE